VIVRALALLVLLAAAAPASAHRLGASYSEWTLTADGAEVRARVAQLDLTRLQLDPRATPDYAAAAGRALARGLQLRAGGERCAPGPVRARVGADGWVRASWSCACARPGVLTIEAALFARAAPGHLHFARARLPSGELRERVLSAAAPALPLPEAAASPLARYVALGVSHIATGWDHLAFVLALLLLAGSLPEMVLIATGFTLAHSLTLAAAALGAVRPHAAWVEAVIGFSIALAAIETLWGRAGRARWIPGTLLALLAALAWRLPPVLAGGLALFTACYFALLTRAARPAPDDGARGQARLRIAMALLFGLVHGFGFAAALRELQLPTDKLVLGLLGFNLGVELGQLLVVGLAWPLLWVLRRTPKLDAVATEGVAAGLCAVGVYWFVVRTLV
jgi:hypothetical protein